MQTRRVRACAPGRGVSSGAGQRGGRSRSRCRSTTSPILSSEAMRRRSPNLRKTLSPEGKRMKLAPGHWEVPAGAGRGLGASWWLVPAAQASCQTAQVGNLHVPPQEVTCYKLANIRVKSCALSEMRWLARCSKPRLTRSSQRAAASSRARPVACSHPPFSTRCLSFSMLCSVTRSGKVRTSAISCGTHTCSATTCGGPGDQSALPAVSSKWTHSETLAAVAYHLVGCARQPLSFGATQRLVQPRPRFTHPPTQTPTHPMPPGCPPRPPAGWGLAR